MSKRIHRAVIGNRRGQRRRGSAAVEFALLLPFIAFLYVAGTDFARVFYYSQMIENCARNGAIYASDPKAPVMLLCRSGARSRAAAIALTEAGFAQAFNIAGGFEGDADGEGHRGNRNGWKAENLPWRQG